MTSPLLFTCCVLSITFTPILLMLGWIEWAGYHNERRRRIMAIASLLSPILWPLALPLAVALIVAHTARVAVWLIQTAAGREP